MPAEGLGRHAPGSAPRLDLGGGPGEPLILTAWFSPHTERGWLKSEAAVLQEMAR